MVKDNWNRQVLGKGVEGVGKGIDGFKRVVLRLGISNTPLHLDGIVNAIVGFFFKFGMALGGVVPGYVLAAFGFAANHTQTAHSLFGIRMVTTIIPIIVTVLAMIVFAFYRLTDEKVEKMNAEIAARNQNN